MLSLRTKTKGLPEKIKVGAVSYLNTKPLLYGLQQKTFSEQIDLTLDYPSRLASALTARTLDLALVPVAAMPSVPYAQIVSDFCIASDGDVASVALFSQMPLQDLKTVYLDYQSRTSVNLVQVLFRHLWKQPVTFLPAPQNYIQLIQGEAAGVIIGDRALEHLSHFPYVYDLAAGWKELTGLPFVFAAWISNRELPDSFLRAFNQANSIGLHHLKDIVSDNPFPAYNLLRYYTCNIQYELDDDKRRALQLFLEMVRENPSFF